MTQSYNHLTTPVGILTSVVEGDAVVGLWLGPIEPRGAVLDPEATVFVDRQITEYFAGDRRAFDLKLAPKGTEFQHQVWALLRAIPYGETRSYGDLAKALGNPGASRAVGRANATNPISIIVPCHRVIGQNGTLTGYAGGLTMKEALLEHERSHATQPVLAL